MPSHPPSRPRVRSARLLVEELEPRQLLAAQPTVFEQVFLERLNDARANPTAYGASIGVNLSGVAPSMPLAFDTRLVEAAHNHAVDMNDRRFFDHVNPSGAGPGQRIAAAGFPASSWAESIAGGFGSPEQALAELIRDTGVPDLGHRRHLLAIDAAVQGHKQVGIGVVLNGSGPLRNYYTVDTASGGDQRPFVTGVVYTDNNGNGRYDAGEGLGGITITVPGVGAVQTFSTGGYSIQVGPGNFTVIASGGPFGGGVSQAVNVGGNNVRVNFTPGGASNSTPPVNAGFVNRLYQRVLGRSPSDAETAFWMNASASQGALGVASAVERSAEARGRLVAGWYGTFLGRAPVGGEHAFWINLLVSGVSEEQTLATILGSPEYFNRAAAENGGGAAGFVRGLYRQLLGRDPRDHEVAYWLGVLPSMGQGGVASFFVIAPEYRAGQIRSYYQTLLRRPGNAGEVGYWVGTGLDLTGIRIFFETSPEFAAS